MQIEINGVEYAIQYPVDLEPRAAAVQMASTFCREKWAVLGITPEDAGDSTVIEARCVAPLTNAFLERISAQTGTTE